MHDATTGTRPGESPDLILLTAAAVAGVIISGWRPFDRLTWLMEVLPVILALPLIWACRRRFPLTPLLLRLILLHAVILMVGGHYTYARVPAGFWVRDLFDLGRNHYDRLGHLAQGFIPAIAAREILLRRTPLRPGGWLFVLVTSACLAVSALYEFLEWGAALTLGSSADEFLGTQGDPWDTQWDMFLAFLGAMASQLLLAGQHDRMLRRMAPPAA
jgi:putative membrane protein